MFFATMVGPSFGKGVYSTQYIYIYIYTIHSFQEIAHSVFVDGWDLVPCQGRTFLCRWQALRNFVFGMPSVFGWPLSISFKRYALNDVFTGRKALDEVAQIWRSQQKHRGGAKKPTVAGTVPCSKIDVWFSRNRYFRVIFMNWSWCFLSLFYWQLPFLCCEVGRKLWTVACVYFFRRADLVVKINHDAGEQVFLLYTCTSTRPCTSC